MYKLIIGNVRVSVLNDEISQAEAAKSAKQAIHKAHQQGKFLSLVEVSSGPNGLSIKTSEKTISANVKKTLQQSMLDSIISSAKECLYPTSMYSQKDMWFDSDTGQEWYGHEVDIARQVVLEKLTAWIKSQ